LVVVPAQTLKRDAVGRVPLKRQRVRELLAGILVVALLAGIEDSVSAEQARTDRNQDVLVRPDRAAEVFRGLPDRDPVPPPSVVT
jgi:hypothetical protein